MLRYISFCGEVPIDPAFDSPCNKSKILRFSSTNGQGLHTYYEEEDRLFNNCGSLPNCLLLYLPPFILYFVLVIHF